MNKSSKITRLKPEIIAKIAAGEVVERPASVIKELLENSIDAGSSEIAVIINNAGISLIEVRDNGVGMSKQDASLAFAQHSTSKIKNAEDLFKISTLGFRGEALSSIRAVSDVELETYQPGHYTKVMLDTEDDQSVEYQKLPDSTTQGTTIKVSELFKHIPARKKFLRSVATEFKHISDIFIAHAIANPNIHFKLTHNGDQVYNLPKTDNLSTRIYDILGSKVASNLIQLNSSLPDMTLSGLVGHPSTARSDRKSQFLFINNRPIHSPLISKAVQDAYHSTIPEGKHPIFYLNIKINPAKADINIHPRKLEVKFENTGLLFSNVKRSVSKTIEKTLSQSLKQRLSNFDDRSRGDNRLEDKGAKRKNLTTQKRSASLLDKRPGKETIKRSLQFSQKLLEDYTNAQDNSFELINKYQQFFNTYLVIEKDERLLFIDQHAADERIKYEQLQQDIFSNKNIETQRLLVPEIIKLTPANIELIKDNLKVFTQFGLDIDIFSKDSIKINAIPSIFQKLDIENFISEIIEKQNIQIDDEDAMHEIIASLACHGSIRAGRKMHHEEIEKMINQLFKCKKPYSCPHGRPVIWEISKGKIDKEFKRTGFC